MCKCHTIWKFFLCWCWIGVFYPKDLNYPLDYSANSLNTKCNHNLIHCAEIREFPLAFCILSYRYYVQRRYICVCNDIDFKLFDILCHHHLFVYIWQNCFLRYNFFFSFINGFIVNFSQLIVFASWPLESLQSFSYSFHLYNIHDYF